MRNRRSMLAGVLCMALIGLEVRPITAQEPIRLVGWVQWVGGTTMQMMTGGGTVAVDLRQADQGSYRGLRTGERVIVDGVVSSDRRRVIAHGVWRSGEGTESP